MKPLHSLAAGTLSAAFLLAGVGARAEDAGGFATADDANRVLWFFAEFDAEMAYCAEKLSDDATYRAAHEEWLRRNLYLREQAFDILDYLNKGVDEADIARKGKADIAATYARVADVAAACQLTTDNIWSGFADISEYDPQLVDLMYTSIGIIAAHHPDSVGAPG